jgi:hypothetical protein
MPTPTEATSTASTEDHVSRLPNRAALISLLREETGWEWDGDDEPASTFGCDTRVPSSAQVLDELADRVIALLGGTAGSQREWTVEYQCPPMMTDWHEVQGTRRPDRSMAELALDAVRSHERDTTVRYRLASREVSDWIPA